jgi:hypothetical protein
MDQVVALEQSCFRAVWKVIKALRAHDDVLAEELDTIRLELGKRTYKSPPKLSKITIDLPVGIGVEFGEALRIQIIENLVEACSSEWNYQFGLLKEFRKVYPDRWPKRHEEFSVGNKLGFWCRYQRKSLKRQSLENWKVTLLNEINFSWEPCHDFWRQQFDYLKAFRKNNPNHWPNKKEAFPEGNKLGVWYGAQQRRSKIGLLKDWQIKALRSLEFVGDAFNHRWTTQFNNLVEFRRLYPSQWPSCLEEFPCGNNLGAWCQDQRENLKNGLLKSERIKALDKLKFVWNPLKDNWNEQCNYLQQFRELNVDRWPKIKEEFPAGNELGIWCSIQRDAYKNKKLTDQKVAILNAIGLPWNIFDETWNKQFSYLKAFRQINPDRWPKKREEFPVGNKLTNWCVDQRKLNKKNKLTPERKMQLDVIDFPF